VIDAGGGTAIDFYTPSLDGKLVAVSLSKGGTEDGTLYFYDTESGRRLEDTIPRVNGGTAGGSAVWKGDGTGVYYTRYPHEGERPLADLPFYQQIYFHKVGTPVSVDTYVIGKEFPKIAEIALSSSVDGQSILADVSNGDGGEHSHWLLANPGGSWVQVTRFEDGVVQARIGGDGAIYMLSRAGAPHKRVLKVPVEAPRLSEAKVVVPETENAIESITPAATRLYVREIVGGPTQVRVYDMDGKQTGLIAMPEVAIVGQAERTTGDDVLIRSQSYTRPPAQFRYRSETGKLEATALAQTSPADFSDCEVTRVFATAPADHANTRPR
jgi:prolyl oligopeptidase